MPASFQYTPLEADGIAIRLLKIHPANPQEPFSIQCSLFQVSLNDHPDYHALSYAWSDEVSNQILPQEITVDGERLTVGPNLAAALKSRRERGLGNIPIWVDAICINQNDINEKSHQILKMRQIYAQAQLVTVWLGPERENSKKAFQMIRKISQQRENSGEWIQNSLLTRKNSTEWRALYHMLRRSWWRRIWIIQEMVAAKDAVVFCGPDQLDTSSISGCLDVLIKQQRIQRPLLLKQESLVLEYGTFSLAGTYFHREPWENDSLLRTLYKTGPASCSDSRDKIYAILNLASDSSEIVPHPDYNISIAETYKQATIKIIQNSNRLDILSLSGLPVYERTLDIELPSWVPDFCHRVTSTINSSISSLTPVFADKNSNATVSIDTQKGTLNVRGFVVDHVDGLAQVLEESSSSSFESTLHQTVSKPFLYNGRKTIDAICQSLIAGSLPPIPKPTDDMLNDVSDLFIQQCCLWSSEQKSFPSPQTFEGWYYYNRTLMVSGKTIETWAHEELAHRRNLTSNCTTAEFFDYRDSQHWSSRRLITTASGNVGLGGNVCKNGDLICIIFGCSTPIILRGDGNTFKLVGEAYIHGIMNGEALDGIASQKYVARDFELI